MPVLVAILTTLAAGVPVALAIDRRTRGATLIGLGFLYGTAAVYAAAFVVTMIGIPWTAANVTALLLVISAGCFIASRRRATTVAVDTADERRTSLSVIDLCTVLTAFGYLLYATIAPVWLWDFWAIWGLKARVFLGSSGIDWRFLGSPWNDFVHPDYPLLVPLNYVYASLLGGGWSDRWLGLYTFAFGVALLLIVRDLAGREVNRHVAATIAFAMTAFALSGFIGMAEGPLIAFGTSAALFLRRAAMSGDRGSMRHAALLLGFAALCKNEGMALVLAALVATALTARPLLIRLWPSLAIAASWAVVVRLRHLSNDLVQGSVFDRVIGRLTHPLPVLRLLVVDLADVWIWVLMAAAVAIVPLRQLRRERVMLLLGAIQLLFVVGAYFVTPHELQWHVATSWSRLTRQVAPLLLFPLMMACARTFIPDTAVE